DLETLAVERLRARAEESVVSVSGQLGWSEGVRWQGGVKLQRVNPGHWLADWPGRLNGQAETEFTLQDSQWALLLNGLDISGTLREWPLALSGDVQRTLDDQLTVDQVRLQLGDNRLVA